MNEKTKLVTAYCVICSVLFIAVTTVMNISGKTLGTAGAVIAGCVYCILMLAGAWLLSRFSYSSSRTSAAPPKGSRSTSHLLAQMRTPAVIVDGDGKLIWYNNAFSAVSPNGIHKESTLPSLCGLSVKTALADKDGTGVLCEYNGHTYRVFGYPQSNQNGRTVSLLWFDVSNEQYLKSKLENERLIIAYVIIDAADNFISGMQEQYADAAAEVTKLLKSWADECGGHIREYSSGKYIMMFYADKLAAMRRDSFPILSEVKNITYGDDAVPMTISVGVADCGGTVADKCALASAAMSFALQRGGDQVVIKNDRGSKDEFFGGLAKHDPQLTGLNARRLVLQATPLIKKAGGVLIMGHKNADFDCLASCMGIAKICLSLGKKPTIIVKNNKNIAKPYEILKNTPDYRDLFYDFDSDDFDAIEHNTLLFILDVNNPNIFEYPEMTKHVSNIIIIDHHRMFSSSFPFETKLTYIEPSASSASEIVAQMLEQFFPSGVLSSDEANILLAGIQLDTNNFTRDCGAGTYAAAQYLRREGADSSESFAFFALDKDDFMLELQIESSMRMFRDRCAICAGDDQRPASDPATAARVADTILRLEGVSASFAVVRMSSSASTEPVYSISGRSDGSVNVQIILERLGGGGHHSNAGTQLTTGKTIPIYEGPLPRLNMKAAVKLLEAAIDIKNQT